MDSIKELKKELRYFVSVRDLKQCMQIAEKLGMSKHKICSKSNVSLSNYNKYVQGFKTLSEGNKEKLLQNIERIFL